MKHFFFLCSINFALIAQAQIDTLKLPFAIAKEKRLPDEELANKKEGIYLTGVPDISQDPVNGFGYGGEASLFFNGKRSDPFFAYTAYRAELDLTLFNTTRNQREFMISLDAPYIFDSKWRLRLEAGFESNPNLLYFGTTSSTLSPLSYYPNLDSSFAPVTALNYADYETHALVGVNQFYNTYFKKESILNVSGERYLLAGKLRALVGYEWALVGISTFAGNSLLQQDAAHSQLLGLGKKWVGIAQLGLIYDTRDLETDPSNGVFAELTNELSLKALGSFYNFNKTFIHANYYHNFLEKKGKKLVIAARFAGGYTAGQAPFFEYQDQWSSEGSIEGLGGAHTLRGFKQSRFLGRVMTFNNLELRWRMAQTTILNQHLAFVAVPFVDAGGVWDELSAIGDFSHYRICEGIGLRIVWNVNTILRFDYAISNEDRQFFFNLAHAF
ncbi:MAG: hypothetical protein RLZZ301_114 [Bacteroidota bacterium]|jgi:outer membrane protein assembly factor BamA